MAQSKFPTNAENDIKGVVIAVAVKRRPRIFDLDWNISEKCQKRPFCPEVYEKREQPIARQKIVGKK